MNKVNIKNTIHIKSHDDREIEEDFGEHFLICR